MARPPTEENKISAAMVMASIVCFNTLKENDFLNEQGKLHVESAIASLKKEFHAITGHEYDGL